MYHTLIKMTHVEGLAIFPLTRAEYTASLAPEGEDIHNKLNKKLFSCGPQRYPQKIKREAKL